MPPLTRPNVRVVPGPGFLAGSGLLAGLGLLAGPGLLAVGVLVIAPGCKAKASVSQCDQLVDRYAQLVVTERAADASAEQIRGEQLREKSEARGDDAFKNCSSEVSQAEFECAMRAPNADALEKCLE